MAHYALIQDNTVQNVIVADASFVALVENDWQAVVRVDELSPQPGIFWVYNGGTSFTPPEGE